MRCKNILKISFSSIKSNKLRSILTMLGLVVGIASVIVLVGIGRGATTNVTSEVASLGTNILTVSINDGDYSFNYNELDNFLELYNVSSISPYKRISSTVSRGTTTSSNATIIATNNNYLDITNVELNEGRDISIIDIENKSKVCIIGKELAETLFSMVDPLMETIKIDGDNYTVIGVLKESGTSNGTDIDNLVMIPLSTSTYLGEDKTISNLYVKIEDDNYSEQTINIIENHIRETLQISTDYFSVSSQSSVLDAMESIENTMSLLLGGIASISLVVGGIGVMNVMLVSVSERTKEIGIRKSLGAKRKDILLQFLSEALMLSLIGGISGILSGLLIGNGASLIGYTFICSNEIIILSFSVSALIGVVFGIFPAYKASLLNPIDALRSE